MKLAALAALAAAAFAVAPQDDMKEIKQALADLKKSVDATDKKIDAMAKDLAGIKAFIDEAKAKVKESLISNTKVLLRQIETACESYEKEQNKYPDDLVADLKAPGPRGIPYVLASVPTKDGKFIDPWGNPIRYQNNAVTPAPARTRNKGRIDLWSFGPSGKDDDGDGDDIGNW